MAALDRPSARPRPVYLNLFAIRLPFPGLVSFLHRASGAFLFLFGIPLLLWGVGATLKSGDAYARLQAALATPLGKLVALALVWAYLHHLFAGLRHLVLDLDLGVDLASARRSAAITFVLALVLTAVVALRLW